MDGSLSYAGPEGLPDLAARLRSWLPPAAVPAQADIARHWELSVSLNLPVFLDAPLLKANACAVVVRQAQVNSGGGLLRQGTMAVVLDSHGRLGVDHAGKLPSGAFATPEGLVRAVAGEENSVARRLGAGLCRFPAFRWTPGLPWYGREAEFAECPGKAEPDLDFTLLPGSEAWRAQANAHAMFVARRITHECRHFLATKAPKALEPSLKTDLCFLSLWLTAYGTLRHAFDSALAALAARLDAPVVDMLRGHERPHLGHYRFYAAPDISPGLRSLRQRALSLYPLLADILPRPAVAAAIDAGQSVDNALQNELGWSATALKALRGLARSGGGRLSVDNLAAALTVTPPEWFPKDPGQWAAFAWLANIPALLGHWPVERFKELGPDWRRSRARIGSHQRLKAIAPFRAGIRDHLVLMPFAMALPDWDSDLRSFEGARLVNTLMEYFLDSRALPEQVEAAQTWHARTEILRPLLRADGDLELSDPARVSAVFAQYLPCLPPSFGEPDAASFRAHPAVRKAVAAERASRQAVSA